RLAYVTVSHWGFDDRPHTGELLIGAEHAAGVVEVFERLFDARFPIEQMRIVRPDELDAPPTGDQNVTGALVCRQVVGGSGSWSMHAIGEAIDINPFHNPYVRGDLVIPELASAYADRDDVRPGMILEGGVVVQAFDGIGWRWGGRWSGLTDPMHFSTTGR
ncbi:MAG TPA: M15 family metallopeptidase, partial [Acidimicrobiia bacterium]|nr:M15 family metallopeptidase [Acidimicrobiia bacterium]